MKKLEAHLRSTTPLLMRKQIFQKKETGETHDAFENRIWRESMHFDEKGMVYIPGQALKNTLHSTALFLSENVAGKGKATYTKHFLSGIMVLDNLELGIKKDDVQCLTMSVPSDGRRGGTTRVSKNFPYIQEWEADTTIYVVDPLLCDRMEKVEEYLRYSGTFIGLLTMRAGKGGQYGRYEVTSVKVSDKVD